MIKQWSCRYKFPIALGLSGILVGLSAASVFAETTLNTSLCRAKLVNYLKNFNNLYYDHEKEESTDVHEKGSTETAHAIATHELLSWAIKNKLVSKESTGSQQLLFEGRRLKFQEWSLDQLTQGASILMQVGKDLYENGQHSSYAKSYFKKTGKPSKLDSAELTKDPNKAWTKAGRARSIARRAWMFPDEGVQTCIRKGLENSSENSIETEEKTQEHAQERVTISPKVSLNAQCIESHFNQICPLTFIQLSDIDVTRKKISKSLRRPKRRLHPEADINRTKADMGKYPHPISSHGPNDEITLGDLHGNALKLIYFLIREGVMHPSKEDYFKLREIYYRTGMDSEDNILYADLKLFEEILNRTPLSPHAPLVRLIGDEMGDRGSNDYFTLLVLEKLASAIRSNGKPPLEILLSNHSLGFIYFMQAEKFMEHGVEPGQQLSSLRLFYSFKNDKTKKLAKDKKGEIEKRVEHIFDNTYLKYLKPLSYSKQEAKDGFDSELSLYSHAPTGLESIRLLAEHYNLSECMNKFENGMSKFENAGQVTQCIDAINRQFQKNIADFHLDIDHQINHPFDEIDQRSPFYHITWNRSYTRLDQPDFIGDHAASFVHGHDGNGKKRDDEGHRVNLDNLFGKEQAFSCGKEDEGCEKFIQPWSKRTGNPPGAFWEGPRPEFGEQGKALGRYYYHLIKQP